MPSEVISLNSNFACTPGLAAFVGVAGKTGDHAHWAHQIAIDLEGHDIACFCEGEWLKAQGVFVPAGHIHSVQPGRQLNLFFDVHVSWLVELFGGKLDTSCASVLDRDTVMSIQSCFYEGGDITTGMVIFANAFELRSHAKQDPVSNLRWKEVIAQIKRIKESTTNVDSSTYSQIGQLFAI